MNWLRNFMAGRYGSDQLGWALLILYLFLSLLLPGKFLRYLCLIPLFLFWFRFLSRNVLSRAAENRIFLQKAEPGILLFSQKERTVSGSRASLLHLSGMPPNSAGPARTRKDHHYLPQVRLYHH